MAIDIKVFINDAKLKGMSNDAIRTALLNMGVGAAEVSAAFPVVVAEHVQPQMVSPEKVMPEITVPQEKKSEVIAPKEIQLNVVPAEPIQSHVVEPRNSETKTAPGQPSRAETDFARMIAEAKAKTDVTSPPSKPQADEPEGIK